MADDKKITDMAELLSGGLHDDLLFEVVDLTEGAVEDQNKKVKMVTLEGAFGAEDKIFEGDSSIEVIDLGTGQIDTTIDAQLLSRYTLAQLYFQVDGADNGVNPYIDLDGAANALKLGYQGDLHLNIGIGSAPTIRAISGSDDWFHIEADYQQLGSSAAGNAYLRTTPTIPQIIGSVNGATELTLDTAGLALKTGASVNEIETTLTDDDTHLPTSGAVSDAIAGLDVDKIYEGDSYVEVVDTGTGYIVMVVDGVEVARWTAASAEMHLGVNDTRQGILHVYGSNTSTEGGKIRLYYGGSGGTGAAEYGDIDFASTGGITIGLPGALCGQFGALQDARFYYQNAERLRTENTGALITRGSNSLRLENLGGVDWTLDNRNNAGKIIIAGKQPGGAEIDFATFDYTGLDLASGMGLSFNGGQAINTIETALTNDDTHLPTSGAVFDAIAAIDTDRIIEGDSSVEVIDAGTGQVDVTVDAGLVARFLASGILELGQEDLVFGTLKLFGQATGSTQGGKLVFEMAADHDGGIPPINEIIIQADQNTLVFGTASNPDSLQYSPSGTVWAFKDGNLGIGVNDVTRGTVNAYGGASTGGRLIAYNAADSDDTIDYYSFETAGEDLNIGPNTDPDALTYLAATGVFQFTGTGGIQLATGGAVNEIETTITDDDTKLPSSGAVVDYLKRTNMLLGDGSGEYIEIDGAGNEVKIGIGATDKVTVTADGIQLKGDQTGAAAIGNAATSVSVTFGTAHADANYQVLCTMENTTDGSPLFLIPVVTAKATTGFTVTLSAATDSANYVLNWMVLRS